MFRFGAFPASAAACFALVACSGVGPTTDVQESSATSSAVNPGAQLLYCAHLRTGIQRRMTGVGPVFHRFSAETLGQLRDVVRQYVPDSSYAAEEEAARIRAWHDISESEMELRKMIPRAEERFRLRRRDCDGLVALLAPNRTLPAFVRRDTSQ